MMPSIAWLLAGALLWSFTEYALHAWYGHRARGRNFFSREHLRHHSQEGYFSPLRNKARAAVPAITLLALAGCLTLGPGPGLALSGGFALAYLGYEWLHQRLHTHAPRGPLGRALRRHHFTHHFHNPWKNQGVTSPVWDLILGTHVRHIGPLSVPPRLAMTWLLDEQGAIRPEFAADYQLARGKSRESGKSEVGE